MEQYSKTPERASMAAIAHAMELRYDVRARENDIKLIDYELFKGSMINVDGTKARAQAVLDLKAAEKKYFDFIHGER